MIGLVTSNYNLADIFTKKSIYENVNYMDLQHTI
jgi:hypothetical protein